jgi:hypothetical protein
MPFRLQAPRMATYIMSTAIASRHWRLLRTSSSSCNTC